MADFDPDGELRRLLAWAQYTSANDRTATLAARTRFRALAAHLAGGGPLPAAWQPGCPAGEAYYVDKRFHADGSRCIHRAAPCPVPGCNRLGDHTVHATDEAGP
jgi:hypothetical protein